MKQPLLFDITCKIYDTKSNYLNDTDGTILPTINDFFNITIFNRGDHIKQQTE